MTRYRIDKSTIEAETFSEAAEIYANRQARRKFGRKGYCRTMRGDSYTMDGFTHCYTAFIGKDLSRKDGGGCQGHNIWISVGQIRS